MSQSSGKNALSTFALLFEYLEVAIGYQFPEFEATAKFPKPETDVENRNNDTRLSLIEILVVIRSELCWQ